MNILNIFRKPTLQQLAQRQLDEARLAVLKHQEAKNYHHHMQLHHQQQVEDLSNLVNGGVPKASSSRPAKPKASTLDLVAA